MNSQVICACSSRKVDLFTGLSTKGGEQKAMGHCPLRNRAMNDESLKIQTPLYSLTPFLHFSDNPRVH